jgi:hypothetical protein
MATRYYYVDECYREHGSYWHCNIGGAILQVENVVDAEVALETQIHSLAKTDGFPCAQGEFKYTDFFRETSDEFKLKIAGALTTALLRLNVRFLVSHAMVEKKKLAHFGAALGSPSKAIQQLSCVNIANYLAGPASSNPVQVIVDLGIAESFRPIYDMYCSTVRSIPMLKASGIPDSNITIPHYRNLPRPVFLDSGDSRLLQYSDFLIGLLLARQLQVLTPFKSALLAQIEPIFKNVEVLSVEWNKGEV